MYRKILYVSFVLLGIFLLFDVRSVIASKKLAPAFYCPEVVELGERELGEEAVAQIEIRNNGGEVLQINRIRTSCSCTGLIAEKDGREIKLNHISIQPYSKINVFARLVIRGVPLGTPMSAVVSMDTNDPMKPVHHMKIRSTRVWGGTTHSPQSVAIGNLTIGTPSVFTVDLWDSQIPPRTVRTVECSGLEGVVQVKLLPPTDAVSHYGDVERRQIGRLSITVDTSNAGQINGSVKVYSSDGRNKPDEIPVFGQISPQIVATPSIIDLPRYSDEGKVYNSQVLLRSIDQKKFRVVRIDSPKDFLIEYDAKALSSIHVIVIRTDPMHDLQSMGVILAHCNMDGRDFLLTIPVTVQHEDR